MEEDIRSFSMCHKTNNVFLLLCVLDCQVFAASALLFKLTPCEPVKKVRTETRYGLKDTSLQELLDKERRNRCCLINLSSFLTTSPGHLHSIIRKCLQYLTHI